jgi:NADH-quinone oxidoreductase subunit L
MLWCVPALPLGAFFLLTACGQRSRTLAQLVGVIGIFLSFIASLILSVCYYKHLPYEETLWAWIPPVSISFMLDPLAILMIVVITFVASLVALYSTQFMSDDPSIMRFFAYLNLFVASMLILVLADNLLLLFAGWEGVGVCSYLLIGFWYDKTFASIAANKAFIMTRIGDVFFLLGIIFLSLEFNTLTIKNILSELNSPHLSVIALLLLIGAVAKSAQIPLQTWLPDAMIGPTPASALIHAATMVTAGVYLMARMEPLFSRAADIQQLVMYIGALTLVVGSINALRQSDLKRVLAYSTISQIGYMFLALGAGAWQAAMFHFTTHAFFKALLFLGAGVIGEALHHEYNMFKMGGLRKELPLTFVTFLMGSAALAGLPLLSAGFYSKELILGETYAAPNAGLLPWLMGCCGAFLTALYVGRMLILVFFGKAHSHVSSRPSWPIAAPLVILGVLSLSAGLLQTPLLAFLGADSHHVALVPYVIASLLPLVGLALSWFFFRTSKKPAIISTFGLDTIYHDLISKPYTYLANILKQDYFNNFYRFLIFIITSFNKLLIKTQNGRIEHYLAVIVASALTILGFLVMS